MRLRSPLQEVREAGDWALFSGSEGCWALFLVGFSGGSLRCRGPLGSDFGSGAALLSGAPSPDPFSGLRKVLVLPGPIIPWGTCLSSHHAPLLALTLTGLVSWFSLSVRSGGGQWFLLVVSKNWRCLLQNLIDGS